MTTQNNSLEFLNLGQFLPNGLSSNCEKLASAHSKRVSTTLQALTHWISHSKFSCQLNPRCQEVRELDNFTWFVSWYSYDSTQSNTRLIYNWPWCHPVGQLYLVSFWVNLTLFQKIFRWLWIHPFNLQFLKLYPDITPWQKYPHYLKKLSHVIILFLSVDCS